MPSDKLIYVHVVKSKLCYNVIIHYENLLTMIVSLNESRK